MSFMKTLYMWLRQRTPSKVRLLLKSLGLNRLTKRWDPRNDPSYGWPLNGVLTGYRMQFRQPEDYQYAARQYEPDVCSTIMRLVRPGWVCLDIGAHIGYMTLLIAKLVGAQGRVFAFEAVPENARLLTKNVELNGYQKRVRVENQAVSDSSRKMVTLYAGPSSFEATVVSRGWEAMMQVPAVALDDYFPPGQQIDFVKMDIEGGEVEAIAGMRRILTDVRPLVLIELHDVGKPAIDGLLIAGYTFYDLNLFRLDVDIVRAGINHCVAAPIETSLLN